MKEKKWIVIGRIFLGLTVLALVIFGGGQGQIFAAEGQLRLSHHYPATHMMGKGYALFAKLVKEKTNRKLNVKVYPGGTLISGHESFDGVKSGTVDASCMISNYQIGHIPELDSFGLPFQFDNHDHYRRTLDNNLFKALVDLYAKNNIKLLNYFPKGAIHIYHKSKHLMNPADFKGEDLRGLGGYITLMIMQLGANAVTIGSPGEVTTALQRGMIHGITTNFSAHVGRGWWEYAPYVSYLNLAEAGEGLGINIDYWNKLSPAMKKIVMEAAHEMNELEWRLIKESDEKICFTEWKKKKCPVKVITAAQKEAMSKVLQPLYEKAKKSLPMTQQVLKWAKENAGK
ncbi:TRAP transporter substrate-binding protein [Thermodesulfobacteriota bacterium]